MSDNLKNQLVWLIGAGPMAVEYAKVLQDQKTRFEVIGRGKLTAQTFFEKTGIEPHTGGLENFVKETRTLPDAAIVAVSMEQLASTTLILLHKGVKRILVEKPAGMNARELEDVAILADTLKAEVYVGYNRRFYASVLKAQEIILEDDGVKSLHFDFTEWSHVIEKLVKAPGVKEQWFLGNSTHVVDLAIYLGGKPIDIKCYTTGALSWHPKGSVFCGAGVTDKKVLFSYHANWDAPGRWSLEVETNKHKLIFKPLEELHIQKIGSVIVEKAEIDDAIDKKFKPGLYREVEAFLSGTNSDGLVTIQEQLEVTRSVYSKIVSGE